jgi:modulator of FtsH protease
MEPVAAEWSDLFVAAAGASAALAGLVFVAVSINIGPIVETPGLPDRALLTLLLLLGVLIVSLFGLIPGQSAESLGLELLVQSAIWAVAVGAFAVRSLPSGRIPAGWYAARLVPPLFGTVPYLVGSILLVSGDASGLDWVFAGMIGALIAAVMNAWVLLVEILR